MSKSDELRDAVTAAMVKQQAPQYGFGPYAKSMQRIGEALGQRMAPPPQQPGEPLSLAPPPLQQQPAPPLLQPQQQPAPMQPTEPWMPPASWEN
jgi:hypothetical protein